MSEHRACLAVPDEHRARTGGLAGDVDHAADDDDESAVVVALRLRPLPGIQLQQPALREQRAGKCCRLVLEPFAFAQHLECGVLGRVHVAESNLGDN